MGEGDRGSKTGKREVSSFANRIISVKSGRSKVLLLISNPHLEKKSNFHLPLTSPLL